jgi:serine/threonine protein kinase
MSHASLRFDDDLDGLPRVGEVFHQKYRVDGVLGVGGMAAVFAATHLTLRERVAIKMLLPEWAGRADLAERFLNEGRAAAKIRSEHVVRVLDVDEAGGRPYMVLEYLDGLDLEKLVKGEGPRPVEEAVDFILQACEAMAEAHLARIVHRDLKPANLFLCHRADGSPCVKVLDFGISKIAGGITFRESGLHSVGTLPTAVMGSPHYMSPEQMTSASSVDARADIWSLGAIVHELLAGKPPFQAETITGLCSQILRDPPPRLSSLRSDVPVELDEVVLHCLEKEPSQRYANVAEVARALAPFGSDAASASAGRITRIFDGEDAPPSTPSSVVRRTASSRPEIRAAEILAGPSPDRAAARRPIAGYVSLALVFLAFAVGIAWKVDRRLHTEGMATAGVLPVPEPLPVPVPPPALAVPSSAPVQGQASLAAATPAPAPPPAIASIPLRRVNAGGAPHHHHAPDTRRAESSETEAPSSAPDDDPYGEESSDSKDSAREAN